MSASFNPAILTSSPLRQLYEVLSVFEAQREWSNTARVELLEKVAARLPPTRQPDIFLLNSLLEQLGVDMSSLSDLVTIEDSDALAGSSLMALSSNSGQKQPLQLSSGASNKQSPTLSPQLASLMTTQEMAAFVMLQLFGELADKRIESWGRVARLIVTQPMDGFATPGWRP